ncbi:hypothetical protein D3P07_00495 [Paenibacillus sp. 1011MAR3C5]|uniref:hypothetical protein n=1 Tax=Paenibacillus sp. 1011MAR3C5 TaxID=1675787 RepID=UPI000E6BD910|nr:hypothetical protein [Paenibacillus sp. 1011MAR3C5]RJE90622.1 hypothetical protein D3P07_00495 [Paenibacillus sp. 1011MAR3C5]
MSGFGDDDNKGLSADDLALMAAIVVVIGDILGLLAVLAARSEKSDEDTAEAQVSGKRSRSKKRKRKTS